MANFIVMTQNDLAYYDEKIKDYVDTAAGGVASDLDDLEAYVGKIPSGATATDVVNYAKEYADGKVNALDTPNDIVIASISGNTITLKAGVKQTNGLIGQGTGSDISLADVAKTGASGDVSYDNTISGLTASNVKAALDELADASSGGVASKTVYITETSGGSSDPFSKRYGIYQGSTGSSTSPVVEEKLVDIDIPKDMVVESGNVVDITFDSSTNKLYDGLTDVTILIKGESGTATAADAGKYIKLIIANATSDKIYISAKDLVDIYTVASGATQVQLAINNNVISATLVAGGVGTTELASSAVTAEKLATDAIETIKIKDANVTANKLASNSVTTAKITDKNVTKAKLEDSVQASLGLADTALQSSNIERIGTTYIDSLFTS
jgi:hypothetical protein